MTFFRAEDYEIIEYRVNRISEEESARLAVGLDLRKKRISNCNLESLKYLFCVCNM